MRLRSVVKNNLEAKVRKNFPTSNNGPTIEYSSLVFRSCSVESQHPRRYFKSHCEWIPDRWDSGFLLCFNQNSLVQETCLIFVGVHLLEERALCYLEKSLKNKTKTTGRGWNEPPYSCTLSLVEGIVAEPGRAFCVAHRSNSCSVWGVDQRFYRFPLRFCTQGSRTLQKFSFICY